MGALVGIQMVRGKNKSAIAASLFVLSFCLFFFLGSDDTTVKRAEAARLTVTEELKIRAEYRVRFLQWCSETEYRINIQRARLGLAPLDNSVVCNEF